MDGSDSQQRTVTVLIKTPSQAQEDQTVEGVCLNWTVRDLKTHLSTVYPTKPAVSDQRLIYAGKLLPDYLHIKDLFRATDCGLTIHLVCPFHNPNHDALGARPKTKQPHSCSPKSTAASASFGPSSPSHAVQTPSTPDLRQRRQTSQMSPAAPAHSQTPVSPPGARTWPAAALAGAPQMTQPAFPTYSLYSPQQLLWLQHVYARQYYMQYQAALAAAGTVPSAPATTIGQYPPVHAQHVPVPAPLANQNPIENLQANQNPAQDGAFIDPGEANQNMRMNAQGGPVMEDEEDMERDWLDWLYTAARFGVLLMIVYFNSNLSRFLLVMGILFLMYLHTAGWFPFRRRVQGQEPNHVQPPEVQHNRQNENRNQNLNPDDEIAERQHEEAAAAADGQGPMTAVLVPPHRVSVMWTVWVFFKTFFSSLIPEVPQGVAN
ncbi:homocysteine-responsive endoplasmic reticulum-resident ubiquitin-like domain member 1 protein [Xyrichtys novacula]|uniref:Homocysteine-responsive endoplasmic reticulum-resident ubiquitin-like domain member 1 protein n=1 Tax=Xyrichtys novacula TaxID=13765 RepID=A0AAV1FA01_XYRNO|nr:homocysteine-responsive endoplasmic reticulum-resident ubiquitin-like domain member 1 protein [Xyrichtys novacula]